MPALCGIIGYVEMTSSVQNSLNKPAGAHAITCDSLRFSSRFSCHAPDREASECVVYLRREVSWLLHIAATN